MATPRQIGESAETQTLKQISKQLDRLIQVVSKISSTVITTTTTAPVTTTTTTSSTTTTTTTSPV